MVKVVYVPLDERPCNYKYPQMLADMTDIELAVPNVTVLNQKKTPADFDKLREWIVSEVRTANYLLISIDLLVYGGIVPSRLHHLSVEECKRRMELLQEVKSINPNIKIYAFNLIMRAPAYSSSEEEPDYYDAYGEQIFLYGRYTDRMDKGVIEKEEKVELLEIEKMIPEEVLLDFLTRREVNHQINELSIDYVEDEVIDHLVIPLDDNAPYGYTSHEQKRLVEKVEQLNLMDQVYIYPGADEIGCTLFARIFTEVKDYVPEVYVRYSSTNGPFITPKFEDRTLNESIKAQLTSVNAFMADSSTGADCVLMVNSPAIGGKKMADDTQENKHYTYYSEVNHREFMQAIKGYLRKNKTIALADVAIINGGDHYLLKALHKQGLLPEITAYAGWNTSGNTLGTVIAHVIICSYYEKNNLSDYVAASQLFYVYRLIEDWLFQSIIREKVTLGSLPSINASYFKLIHVKESVIEIVERELKNLTSTLLSDFLSYEISAVDLPWDRMFEVDFTVEKKRLH